MFSLVLIIPAALRDDANALAEALGHGPSNYSVPLSPTGQEPATHWGLHTWAQQSFIDMLEADEMPEGLDQYAPVKDAVIASVRTDMTGHFNEVCAVNGLMVVTQPETV